MEPIYAKMLHINDAAAEAKLAKQVLDPTSKYYGGIIDDESGIPRANHGGTPCEIATWTAALVNPDSQYYHDLELLAALDKAADFILRRQHSDGTVSLGSTNFNSPPDTAFVVVGMVQVVQLLQAHGWEEAQAALAKLELFLERTIPALLTGGCHTPNHRWVITGALCLLHALFPLPELIRRAEEWLAEGMDMTADGEWTERSNGIYNAVSDIALYHAGRLLGRPELLECVRRNLRMMQYLVHPSGEVVTDYSGRQDFGQKSDMNNYFIIFRLMAALDRDPQFAAMSDYAASFKKTPGGVYDHTMVSYLLYPAMHIQDVGRAPLPERYVKVINGQHPGKEHLQAMEGAGHHSKILHSSMHTAFGAPLARIRDGDLSAAVMAKAPSFFSLRHGDIRLLGVKLASSFSPGIVAFDEFTEENGAYKLGITLEKGYNGPIPRDHLPILPGREQLSPWYLLPHQLRQLTHVQQHRLEAEIAGGGADWTIRVKSDEREDVFAQVTFIFGAEGRIDGGDVQQLGERSYVLKSGAFMYEAGGSKLEIGTGAYEHWLPVLREDRHPDDGICVHVNLVTPFDRVFTLRLHESDNLVREVRANG